MSLNFLVMVVNKFLISILVVVIIVAMSMMMIMMMEMMVKVRLAGTAGTYST